jgi:AraC-like DNA-binding protein
MKWDSTREVDWHGAPPDAHGPPPRGARGTVSLLRSTRGVSICDRFPISRSRGNASLENIGEPETANAIDSPHRGARSGTSPEAQLLSASCRGELARLASILRDAACTAFIRRLDGTVFPPIASDCSGSGSSLTEYHTLSAPIYDPEGSPLAFLELAPGSSDRSPLMQKLLRAIVECSARAMTERWFRIRHLRHWIIAAVRADDPDRFALLAVDRECQLVGADRGSRQILRARGMDFKPGLPLSAFFRSPTADLFAGRHCERSMRLPATDEGAPWLVLITPPDLSDSQLEYSNRVLLHSRPRMETIASLGDSWAADTKEPRGLPPRLRRRIDECIDAQLESRVDITELAMSVGFSPSHFFRMFRKSFGMTPHSYVMRRRLFLAQELLTTTDLGLAEIALKAGFSDQSHFCRSFHRFTGMPPRAFRMQHT